MSKEVSTPNRLTWLCPQWLASCLDWLTQRERFILALGVAFQVVFLLILMAPPLITLATGESVLLRVVPIDPHDIFRGDYVTLSYEINRPGWDPSKSWEENWAHTDRMRHKEGQPIYVLLEKEADGKHWRSSGYQFEPPSDGKFIRGTVSNSGWVQFGIEQYFVEEGQGRDYEKAFSEKKLSAEVALDKNGSAQIKRLIIE